ncbi:PH domain-containing protein [Actinoplanes sp. LDG1-06]|uniref:PH domain-containing protein n=1 Tax=Paractinoplanes ovalisporus TaxID=2810368 RepID=A0ABS2AHN6_9ACTN|nr:PH domain-containing protein [Actinoplanes ovalisporus]MBM2619347.1 PH domain-containing protein [Actinoplanes ovalisporus]
MTAEAHPWRRLSVRAVYLDLIRLVGSLVPGFLGVTLGDDGPIWFLVAGSVVGLLGAGAGLIRWMTTRYRVTPELVEMRSGLVQRKHRTVNRDRIRTVDSTAKWLHRVFGLRVVHIGSGDTGSSFDLDALDRGHAAQLHRELSPGAVVRAEAEAETDAATSEVPETVIARWDARWVPLNAVNVWAVLTAVGPPFALYWFLRPFGVDLLDIGRALLDRQPLGGPVLIAVGVLVAYAVGFAGNAVSFVLQNANFQLVRRGTAPDTALVTHRGLLSTQTLQRDDRRLRGLQFTEPLLWRWLGLTETKVITTGLKTTGESGSGDLVPRVRMPEARDIAARVLADDHRPLEAALHRHPRGALVRRIGWALWGPALGSAVLALFVLTGALPDWVWPLPLALIPLTVPLAVVAYRSLGHALTGPYLVVRHGATQRHTVALQRRAVIGWSLRQSLLQRWGDRMTIGIATAAGARHYEAHDAGVDQTIAFLRGATPELAAEILEPVAVSTVRSTAMSGSTTS